MASNMPWDERFFSLFGSCKQQHAYRNFGIANVKRSKNWQLKEKLAYLRGNILINAKQLQPYEAPVVEANGSIVIKTETSMLSNIFRHEKFQNKRPILSKHR